MTNVIQLRMGIVEFPPISLMKEVLNKSQCENLLLNLQNGVATLQSITNGPHEVFHKAEEDLYKILHKARVLIEECCREDWCRIVVKQINNKECFRELLVDFENCFHTICDMVCLYNPDQEIEILAIRNGMTFYPTSIDAIEDDEISICGRMSKHLDSCKIVACNDCKLVQYVQKYIRSLRHVEGGELDNIEFPREYPHPDYGSPPLILGRGFSGVYRTVWLGVESATRCIYVRHYHGDATSVWKEASILGRLSHPNIIKFMCCGLSGYKIELVMELGMETLSQYLGAQPPLEEKNAIDIMLQIVKGMCYLHDMRVAHGDLKPDNVVVNRPNDLVLNNLGCLYVKLLDFGIEKIKLKNFLEVPSSYFGTRVYNAPEAMAQPLMEDDAFKADVFSFGMICSYILSGEKPTVFIYKQKSKRPILPKSYSEELRSIVHDCLSLDPTKRPTFLDIQIRLTSLKNAMFKGVLMLEGVSNYTSGSFWKGFPTLDQVWDVLKFNFFNNPSWFPSTQEVHDGSSNTLSITVNNDNMTKISRLIGLQDKVFQLERQLQSVGCLGIVGVDGIGKSTLARALSNHISHYFDATCFVFDLRNEICTISLMHKLNDTEDLLPQTKTLLESRNILKTISEKMKILLIVDNVINQGQLCSLLGYDMFRYNDNSRFIVTSCDWNSLEIHVPIAGKVDMNTLTMDQSMKLFCMHAFGIDQSCPPHLKDVVEKIVDACCGLPMRLEEMGVYMQGEKRLRIWERALHRLLRAQHGGDFDERIWRTLRTSFDGLNDQEKNIFLDIACFFCKDACHDSVYATQKTFLRILDWDIDGKNILANLEKKSLIKIGDGGYLEIHNQLRHMGCMIMEEDFARTRILNLCYLTFAYHCKQKGIEFVHGLAFTKLENTWMRNANLEVEYMGGLHVLDVRFCENIDLLSAIVKKSPNLRCLKIHFSIQNASSVMVPIHVIDKFFINTQYFLHDLRVLELFNCNFLELIPCEYLEMMSLAEITFSNCKNVEKFLNGASKLTTLEEMRFFGCNTEKIPQEIRNLTCLKKLSMKESKDVQLRPMGLSNLLALEELDLSECWCLEMIPEGFGSLISLEKLDIRECEALEKFPLGLSKLSLLRELNLSNCWSLKEIHEGFGSLKNLKKLHLQGCEALKVFPSGLGNLFALEELNFSKCRVLKTIPEGFGSLKNLKKLYLQGCEALEHFPFGLSNLLVLEELDLSKCRSLKEIPEGFGCLRNLKKLDMCECEALKEFPLGLSNLFALEELNFSNCRALMTIPEGFGSLTSLKKLCLQGCEALEHFPFGLNHLLILEELDLSKCRALKEIPEGFGCLTSLKKLDMCECEALKEFPLGLSNLFALEELNFSKCRVLKTIPKGFGSLKNLKKLYLQGCEALEHFPFGLSNLLVLEELDLSKCWSLKEIPEGFGCLRNLKKLDMCECEALKEFPLGLSNLFALEELNFSNCWALMTIPEGFGSLTSLKKLCLQGCEALEHFPFGLNHLLILEELDLSKCRALKEIPEGFGCLKSLKKLDMCECEALKEFPLGLSNLFALEELNFSNCRALMTIPEGFGSLTSLKKLCLQGCEALEHFPFGLNHLLILEELDLSKCRALKEIPEGFGCLTSLKKLDMCECEALKEFPLGLSNLFALEELNFSKCRALKMIPEGFGSLTRLKELHMWECEVLKEIPLGLSNLLALEELNFSKCRSLKTIPEGFGSLTNLKRLYLQGCEGLEEFPTGLSSLCWLEELDISKCQALEVILEGFGCLTSLKSLNMRECEALKEFPSGLRNLVALEKLDLSKCWCVKRIPEGFETLRSLKKLDMLECKALEEFPQGLNNILGLEEFNFSKCSSKKKY